MNEDEEYREKEERAERIADLKRELSLSLEREGVSAFPWELGNDIYVSGPLSVIVEWARDWRSEIEELGGDF